MTAFTNKSVSRCAPRLGFLHWFKMHFDMQIVVQIYSTHWVFDTHY